MKMNILAGIAAIAIVGATPVVAQNYGNDRYGNNSGWDSNSFWRGAPASPRDRIQFLQQRIQRGMADGSLTRREGRDAQAELNNIRYYSTQGHWSDKRSAVTQQRLDALSQRLHWARRNGSYANNGGYNNGANNGSYNNGGNGYYAANDPRFRTDYDATRYYRDGPNYSERRLTAQDEVYRGSDGRYYCKRNDGTTGLIVGAVGGGVLGNVVDGGHNRAAGTLIGGALGALLGKSIDQNNDVRCR